MLCSGAFAQTGDAFMVSGNAFLRDCSVVEKENTTPVEITDSVACLFYVAGVLRGAEVGSALTKVQAKEKLPKQTTLPKLFCRPDNIEMLQNVKIVLKFVRENPERANEETSWLVVWALRSAYPCPAK